MRSRFGLHRRLRTAAEFDAVFKRGARIESRLFVLVVAPNQARVDRLGLAVSRRVGGAVARNRARRLLRESFRRTERRGAGGLDLVAIAQRELVACGQAEVDSELRERFRRIEQRRGPDGAPVAAAD